MTNELWNNYKKETNKQIEDLQLKIMKIQDIRNLNHYWNLIHKGIMNAAIKIIPNHMTPTQHKERKYNQSHMINTFLERNKRRIVIDRVMKKQKDQQILITDPDEIKYITNEHFQTCPGGTHIQKEIPDTRKEQYTPLTAINPIIYKYLMTKPTYNELLDVLKQLPNDKASGPSAITNKMLKNLGSKMSECI
ncbi:14564_t:CDS:2 [Entrophospora sp. SA101]|nr:14564_t:CDS:2 [Entrophospora sp. SA101]